MGCREHAYVKALLSSSRSWSQTHPGCQSFHFELMLSWDWNEFIVYVKRIVEDKKTIIGLLYIFLVWLKLIFPMFPCRFSIIFLSSGKELLQLALSVCWSVCPKKCKCPIFQHLIANNYLFHPGDNENEEEGCRGGLRKRRRKLLGLF